MSSLVVPVVWLCKAINPTSLPILASTQLGKESAMICSAKACEATFSLVRIIIFSDGSTVINPAIIAAAALVLLAPNTPVIGQSVLPSSNDKSSAERVARKWPSRLWTNGWKACRICSSSSVRFWGLSVSTSCMSRKVVSNSFPLSCGGIRPNRSSDWTPHPRHSLSAFVNTASFTKVV